MKKQITLSLLILNLNNAHTMENETWFLSSFSLRSFLPAWFASTSNQKANESKVISDLRESKNNFENQLPFINQVVTRLSCFKTNDIQKEPRTFLRHCYYYRYWKTDKRMVQLKDLGASLLEECRKTQIDGYSALGAAIIAEQAFIEEKHDLIQELIIYGFKPTPKDIELAKLILYDAITEHHRTLLHLLHPHSEINWSALPHEIRKIITQHMLQLFKNEFWLLPETTLNNL